MQGKFDIQISDNRICYDFTITRNITIINGDSGTGKTTLVRMIARSVTNSGISININTDSAISTLTTLLPTDRFWKEIILASHNTIFFVDENFPHLTSKEFASVVKHADCYFVIITRENLQMLPYSVDEIYEIVTDNKYPALGNHTVHLCENIATNKEQTKPKSHQQVTLFFVPSLRDVGTLTF